MTARAPSPQQIEIFSQKSAKKHSAIIEKLKPIARELALRAGHEGVTVSDLRLEADRRGIETRNGHFLGVVMRAAELVATDQYRRSAVDGANGNLNKVHVHPDFRK